MSKSEITLSLERNIWNNTHKLGTYGCFEVTIGWAGNERADYVTYDTKGIWRFYEIKSTKADFHSRAKHSFYGHFNYFVMPAALYEEVKNEIPDYVGVTDGVVALKKAKRIELSIDSENLKDYFLRSLQREYTKDIDSKDNSLLGKYKKLYAKEKRRSRELNGRLIDLCSAVREKYGSRELRELLNGGRFEDNYVQAVKYPSCPLRHKNGNCMALFGFCTSNDSFDCEAVRRAYEIGKQGE